MATGLSIGRAGALAVLEGRSVRCSPPRPRDGLRRRLQRQLRSRRFQHDRRRQHRARQCAAERLPGLSERGATSMSRQLVKGVERPAERLQPRDLRRRLADRDADQWRSRDSDATETPTGAPTETATPAEPVSAI